MRTLAALLVVISLAPLAAAEHPRTPSGFPVPDRPVAPIVSSEYSDEKTRDRNREAERVMDALAITHGLRVADIGAGNGYYTVRLARRLGAGATIYAQDVSRDHLKQLERRLRREKIRGVTLVLGEPTDPKLSPASIDVAILSHMYHEIENPYEFLFRLHASLASGARVAVIDADRPTEKHGTPPALLRCEVGAVGYRELMYQSLAPGEGYLMVFAPPPELPAIEAIKACPQ